MAKKFGGLGKGLDAIFMENESENDENYNQRLNYNFNKIQQHRASATQAIGRLVR